MAAEIEVHPLTPFDPVSDPISIGQHWKRWKRRFETYLVTVDIKEDKQNVLCYCIKLGKKRRKILTH